MIERKLAALCVRNIFPSVGGMTLCLIRHIVRGRGLVVEVAVRTCKALCLFGIGVFEERLTLAAHRAVLAGNFVEEIFLQVGIGSQPATRFPERGRTQTRLVDLAAVTIDGLAVFVILLQPVPAFALFFAHNLARPCLRDGQIPYKQIAPHLFGDGCRAEDILVRVKKSDLVDGIAIALGKIATDSFAVRKAVPKFPIAAELQTLQHRVLSAREVLRVRACHVLFPRLFGGKGHAFQILHRKPLFAVTEIGIYGGELVRFEFEHRNRGVPIARGSLFVAFWISIPCGFACVKLR